MTIERQQDDEVTQYESFADLIEPYIDAPFEKLPESLRTQVPDAFFCMPHWDNLRPHERRSLAKQHDYQTDPARGLAREYWGELAVQVMDTEASIEKWQLMNHQGLPSEAALKEMQLAMLNSRLCNLKKLLNYPLFTIQDWGELNDAKLAATLEKVMKVTLIVLEPEPIRYHLLATRAQLCTAFGVWGLTLSMFKNLTERRWLMDARKVKGKGQKGHVVEPLFCPFEVMRGLATKTKKPKFSEEKGWDILENKFEAVFEEYQQFDTREQAG